MNHLFEADGGQDSCWFLQDIIKTLDLLLLVMSWTRMPFFPFSLLWCIPIVLLFHKLGPEHMKCPLVYGLGYIVLKGGGASWSRSWEPGMHFQVHHFLLPPGWCAVGYDFVQIHVAWPVFVAREVRDLPELVFQWKGMWNLHYEKMTSSMNRIEEIGCGRKFQTCLWDVIWASSCQIFLAALMTRPCFDIELPNVLSITVCLSVHCQQFFIYCARSTSASRQRVQWMVWIRSLARSFSALSWSNWSLHRLEPGLVS